MANLTFGLEGERKKIEEISLKWENNNNKINVILSIPQLALNWILICFRRRHDATCNSHSFSYVTPY